MISEEKRAYNKTYNAQYRLVHAEKLHQQDIAYTATHRKEKRAYDAQYRADHRDLLKKKKHDAYKAQRQKDIEEWQKPLTWIGITVFCALFIARQTELVAKHKARVNLYRQTHPEVIQAAHKRHRAVKTSAPVNDFTAAQWQEIKVAYGYRCVYCGRKMQRLEQDHITALSNGGSHTATNIVPACRSCNARKHAGPPLIAVQPLLLTIAPSKKPSKQPNSHSLAVP